MKILISTPIFPPVIGGPATYTYELAKKLTARGHRVKIVTFARKDVEKINNVEIRSVDIKHILPIRHIRFLITLIQTLKHTEVIYAQGPLVVGFSSFIASKILRKPIIIKFVGSASWEKAYQTGKTKKLMADFIEKPDVNLSSGILLWLETYMLTMAEKVVTPSLYLKNILIKYYYVRPSKIVVVHNAFDLDNFEKISAKIKNKGQTVVVVGRLVPWKGVDEVIEVIPNLVERYPKLKLLIVGDGPERNKLLTLVKNLKVDKSVVFLGGISHERTIELLKQSDIFVLNSRYEGLPHTVIEAMACWIPVIATNIDPHKEIIDNGIDGLLVDVGNQSSLIYSIELLIEDMDLRRKFVRNAYKKVLKKYTWKRTLDHIVEVFGTTLSTSF